jgi:ABC-2 type transport system permease protein
VLRGLGVDAAYAAVFWLLAWARFSGKDNTS